MGGGGDPIAARVFSQSLRNTEPPVGIPFFAIGSKGANGLSFDLCYLKFVWFKNCIFHKKKKEKRKKKGKKKGKKRGEREREREREREGRG